jgi:hypothetical protein
MRSIEIVSDLDSADLLGRFEVADGICASSALEEVDLVFEQDTFAPVQRWRPASVDDLTSPPVEERTSKYWLTLGLYRIPPRFLDAVLAAERNAPRSPLGHDLDYAPPCQPRIESVADALDQWPEIIRFGPLLGMAINRQEGGEYLSTPEPHDEKRKTGLHVDSWDHKPWWDRSSGSNRISINIGRFTRHLVFCTLPVVDISHSLEAQRREFPTGLMQDFFRRRPDTRVYRMRIEPGEGYIAPTENIIHDGSTLLVNGEDAQIVIRGFLAHASMIERSAVERSTRLRPVVLDAA